jgi:hypothetical protein
MCFEVHTSVQTLIQTSRLMMPLQKHVYNLKDPSQVTKVLLLFTFQPIKVLKLRAIFYL